MNAIKTTHIDGDVSVGRNVSIGGRTTQQGNMHVKGSVKIDGWIDAKHIKAANKGLFLTAEDLMESYPEPRNGWWAIVGNTIPGIIHIAKEGTWYSTKQLGGSIEIDIDYYNNLFEKLSDDTHVVQTKLDSLDNELKKIKQPFHIDSIISDDRIRLYNSTCLEDNGEVVYLPLRRIFAYCSNDLYYVSWNNVYDYMLADLSAPIPNRTFEYNGRHYIYANGELMLLANEIIKFHGIIDTAEFTDVSISSSAEFDGKVYFINNASIGDDNKNSPRKPIFANCYNSKYYVSISHMPEYVKDDNDGTYCIREDKIYEYNGSLYVFNGEELLPIGNVNRIIVFHGIIESGEISDKLPYANGTVVYIRDQRSFVNYSEGIYYRKWSGRNIYMDSTTELPHDNKIFRCENKLYIFDGDDLISLSGVDLTVVRDMVSKCLTAAKTYADNSIINKVDKIDGKGLSTEDFTTILKQKLESLKNFDSREIENSISQLQKQINTLVSGNASTAIESFNEIIAFLEGIEDSEDLSSIIASIEQSIAKKADASSLSKVAESGSYKDLKDKPNIPSVEGLASEAYVDKKVSAVKVPKALSELSQDETHRLVTDTEKASWNAKNNFSGFI